MSIHVRIQRAVTIVAFGLFTILLHVLYRYDEHWWWDNTSHFSAGISLGAFLSADGADNDTVMKRFLTVATLWELFEWKAGVSRSMGDDEWDLDRRIEDTILDTVMGLWGVKLALRVLNDRQN